MVAIVVWLQAAPEFGEIQKWIVNNGFAVVMAILLLMVVVTPLLTLLRYVIRDAVTHFNRRLDQNSVEVSAGFRALTGVIQHLDETLDKLANQSAANHEALTSLMLFTTRTQTELVAHRAVVEPTDAAISTPAPIFGVVKPVNPDSPRPTSPA